MKNHFFIILFLCKISVYSQIDDLIWDKTIGGNEFEYLSASLRTNDDAFLLFGASNSDKSGEKSEDSKGGYDYWIVKMNNEGGVIWDKTIGSEASDSKSWWSGNGLLKVDGGYIIAGSSPGGISGDKSEESRGLNDYWIVKIDSSGNIIWDRTYGGEKEDYLTSIIETSDGGILIGGISYSGKNGDRSESNKGYRDYWIVKIDSAGNKEWDRSFGGSSNAELRDIVETEDLGFILAGTSFNDGSEDTPENNEVYPDYWIVKIDSKGDKLWDRSYGGDLNDILITIFNVGDGTQILAGLSNSNISGDKSENCKGFHDTWIIRIDNNGDIIWDRTIGGEAHDFAVNSVELSPDGHLIFIGAKAYFGGQGKLELPSFDNWFLEDDKSIVNRLTADVWVVKLSVDGDFVAERTIGGNWIDVMVSSIQLENNGIMFFGFSNSDISGDKTEYSRGHKDFWVLNTVYDLQKPIIFCPQDISQTLEPGASVNVNVGNPGATDNSSGLITFRAIRSDGLNKDDPYPLGNTTITWIALDSSGNVSSPCEQSISINLAQSVTDYILVDADSDKDILALYDGIIISSSSLPSNSLTIRADVTPDVTRMSMKLTGPISKTSIERIPPFCLFGDNSGDYNGRNFTNGVYTLEGTPNNLSSNTVRLKFTIQD